MNNPIVAIYRERDDGDWEFVAAFNRMEFSEQELSPQFLASLSSDRTRAIEFPEPDMPSVYSKEEKPT